ncbi:hypothetical protein R1479_01187 [Ralstonia mannitolilytica]|nr:hypothetical protein R1479_01187 [Ralstonia mannitolilytica]
MLRTTRRRVVRIQSESAKTRLKFPKSLSNLTSVWAENYYVVYISNGLEWFSIEELVKFVHQQIAEHGG